MSSGPFFTSTELKLPLARLLNEMDPKSRSTSGVKFFMLGLAVFTGVFGAMRANDLIAARNTPVLPILEPSTVSGRPVAFEGSEPTAGRVDFRAAAKRVNPSVVSVDKFNRYQRGFFDDSIVEAETGTGSGVVVSADGVIVTNNHVVQGAERVRVRLSDGRSTDAKVVGTDPISDLAVLRITAKNLQPIEIGDSRVVEVGQWVMAVGNPLGFDNTVSVGVVSSLKRSLPVNRDNGLVDAIQTDAAINPGNSGGALCDSTGRLIGINSAIASSTGQSVGIGFAIPTAQVKRVVDDILKIGYVRYAGLGISYSKRFDGALAYPDFRRQVAEATGGANVPESGILIRGVQDGAEKAGLRINDVLLAVDNQSIESTFDLNRALVPKKPGEKVKVKIWARGETKIVDVVLDQTRRVQ
jgi:S1-C subfamily serine protease